MIVCLHQYIRMAKYTHTCTHTHTQTIKHKHKSHIIATDVWNVMLYVYPVRGHHGAHFAVVSVTTKLTNDLPNELKNWTTCVVALHFEMGSS